MIKSIFFPKFMHQSHSNKIELKLIASIASLAVACETTYKYRHCQILISLIAGLLTHLLFYWYFIPLFLIYLFPLQRKLIQLWFSFINTFSDQVLQTYSTKLCQMLPSIWRLKLHDNMWPIENIRLIIIFGSLSIPIYFSLKIYSYLFFGIIFNLCITAAITILVISTLWYFLVAIDRNVYPFVLVMIIQHFIIPIKSLFYIPLIFLLMVFLFPYFHQLLTSNFTDHLINNIQLRNFRTYLEFDDNYKRFSSEIVNLFVTIYLLYHIFMICLTNNLSWILTISILSFLFIYFYIKLIDLISIQPNLIMFIISSIILSKYILHGDFMNKYFLSIMILMVYFFFIYPLFYLILRRLTIKLSNKIGLKLKFIREKIHRKCFSSFCKK